MTELILTVKHNAVIKFRGPESALENMTAKEFVDAIIPQRVLTSDRRVTFHLNYKRSHKYKYQTTDPEAELKLEDADE